MSDKTYHLFVYRHLGNLMYKVIESEKGVALDTVINDLYEQTEGSPENTWIIYGFELNHIPERLPI